LGSWEIEKLERIEDEKITGIFSFILYPLTFSLFQLNQLNLLNQLNQRS